MGRPDGEIVLDVPRESHIFTCGDVLKGRVVLNSKSSFTVTSIEAIFLGRMITNTKEGRAGAEQKGYEERIEQVDFVRITKTIFPKLELNEALPSSSQLTLPPGLHEFEFEIEIPKFVENNDKPEWSLEHLPPAVPRRGNSTDGFLEINYLALAYIHNPGMFTRKQRLSSNLRFLPTDDCQLHDLEASRLEPPATAAATLDLYDQNSETWGHMFRRLVGTAKPDWQVGLQLSLETLNPFLDIISIANQPLKGELGLQLHAEYFGLMAEKKSHTNPDVSIQSLEVKLVWKCPITAKNQERTLMGSITLLKFKKLNARLVFDEFGKTDLSQFFGITTFPGQLVPSFSTPNAGCTWYIKVSATFTPCHGVPLVAKKMVILQEVTLATTRSSLDGDIAPPSYDEKEGSAERPNSVEKPSRLEESLPGPSSGGMSEKSAW